MALGSGARRELGGAGARVLGRDVWLLLALLMAASASVGVACRDREAGAGIGGQSGDEGLRPTAPWLGTGGVSSEPPRR